MCFLLHSEIKISESLEAPVNITTASKEARNREESAAENWACTNTHGPYVGVEEEQSVQELYNNDRSALLTRIISMFQFFFFLFCTSKAQAFFPYYITIHWNYLTPAQSNDDVGNHPTIYVAQIQSGGLLKTFPLCNVNSTQYGVWYRRDGFPLHQHSTWVWSGPS